LLKRHNICSRKYPELPIKQKMLVTEGVILQIKDEAKQHLHLSVPNMISLKTFYIVAILGKEDL